MGMTTKASIDITAARAEVFRWLIEPAKLTAWSSLAHRARQSSRRGWAVRARCRKTRSPIRAGDSLSTYTLTETGAGTHLELASDTDWAAPDTSALDTAMAGQDAGVRQLVEAQLERMEADLAHGQFDAGTQALMQKSVEDSLAKLKALIENERS